MNERIQELAKQAGVCFYAASTDYFGYEEPAFVNIDRMDVGKFAQLIIKECADYLNVAMEVYTQSEQDLYDRGATKIKQHFGIEE